MTPAFHPGAPPLLRKRPRTSNYPLQGLANRSYVLSSRTPFVRAQRYRVVLRMGVTPASGDEHHTPILQSTVHSSEQQDLPDASATFWIAAASEAAAAAFAVLLCSLTGVPVLGKGWALSPRLLLDACLWTVPFSATFWALEKAPTGIQAATEAKFKSFFGERSLWEIAVFCICVAFGEELLFRSWLLAGLNSWMMPAPLALTFSSVVFGMLHAYTKVYMLLAGLAGLMFGSMFLATGQSVLEPLVVHFLYDFCTIVVMQRKWLSPKKSP